MYNTHSGGVKGCDRSVNPCATAVPRQQAVVISFSIIIQYQFFAFHSTILHTNRGQLFGAHDTRRHDVESKFSKVSRGWHLEGEGRGKARSDGSADSL